MDRDTAPSRHQYNVDKLSCVMSNSHQRDSRKLSSSVRLCERIQPSMWLHLCPHLRVSMLARVRLYCSRLFGLTVSLVVFIFQRAQQNPGVQLLPDRPGRPPPSLRGRLVLPVQHVRVLRQPGQGCQISQGLLTPTDRSGQTFIVSDTSDPQVLTLYSCVAAGGVQ